VILHELRDDCALMVHDPDYGELSKARWNAFLRSAAQDARSSGWFLHYEDDESLVVASNDFDYTVPDGFAYIDTIYLEETINGVSQYRTEIPQAHWEIRLDGGVPTIYFFTHSLLVVDKNLKIQGQARPTIYMNENEPIDGGMESFLRERAMYFAFRYLGAGLSELDRWRQQMSQQCWQTSEAMLARHPQEFRMRPNAREVPGRA
jgi:hypothetical protein